MGKRKDLTGMRFGRLIVKEYSYDDINKKWKWKCICECGKEVLVLASCLVDGHTNSCGCYRKEKTIARVRKDLTGMVFGRLTVKKYSHTDKRGATWACLCECGKPVIVYSSSLVSGHTGSCGCYQKERTSVTSRRDLTNIRFGKLLAIKMVKVIKDNCYWKCVCDCGGETIVNQSHLVDGNTKSCGCLRESAVAYQLKKYYKDTQLAVPEYRELKNPKTGSFLPYDIFIPKDKAYIEIQGKQHYEFSEHWHKNKTLFEHRLELDELKKEHALKNGIFVEVDLRNIKTTEYAIVYINNILI